MIAERAPDHDESRSADLYSLPAGWVWADLGSIAEITMGNSPPGTAYNSRGRGLPLINGPTEFGPGPLDAPTTRQFTEEYTRVCQPGDLLICVRGSTTGRTNLACFAAAIGRGVASIRAFDLQPYINHFIWSRSAALLGAASGSTFPSISAAQLRALAVPLPPLEEQTRIVSALKVAMFNLDTGIERLRKARADLPQLRAAVLRTAMTGELTAGYRRSTASANLSDRFAPRSSASEASAQASLFEAQEPSEVVPTPRLPDAWRRSRIDELCDVRLGQSKGPSNRAGRFATPYLRAANITEDGLQLEDVLTMDFPTRQRELYRLQAGDIIIAEASGSAAQVGKPAIWRNQLPLCCFQNTIIRLRPTAIDPEFALAALQHCYFNGIFAELSAGVGINHLGASRLSAIEIPVPPADEQKMIASEVADQLAAISQSRSTIERVFDRAEQLRRSVWKQAFSGRLVPSTDKSSAIEAELQAIQLKLAAEATKELAALPATSRRSKDANMPIALENILRDYPDGLTPERLFAIAGYGAEQVDEFYTKLNMLVGQIEEVRPDDAAVLQWPRVSEILVRLKEV
ncbi:restriction endonuclease subunit S [Sphingomonas yunnanensis]|uniref:restriction endonuclease subunit S n=1 Tax=Sphingomonas yunnanensis TaxID=310400 RepID=UPI001CA6021D|nr:restriction endonuclease subunit S [Sphingomonas yunnanensis]MBY9064975.1 restriction endonuclease subunit S [Sphingomonas yunnanensis]